MSGQQLVGVLGRNASVVVVAVLVLVLGVSVATFVQTGGVDGEGGAESKRATTTSGVVQDETGKRLAGATVTMGSESTKSNSRGEFTLDAKEPALAKASLSGHLDRTMVLEPGRAKTISLTGQREDTLSLRFGGDVMAGRRFYEKSEERGPLLTAESGAADHARLLEGVRPLLQDADLSMVNLETPLVDKPYFDPSKPRPKRFHQSKEIAFATDTSMAKGLKSAGVDVVSLGNNHVMDGYRKGLDSTVKALDEAGVAHFGAGRNDADAWKPTYVKKRGQTVGYIGCTTVDGIRHPTPYVASKNNPGAARCNETKLRTAVSEAKKQADVVVFAPHGAVEYRRQQVSEIRDLMDVARRAGASVVAGHHPHVVGGVTGGDDYMTAESTGNLLFDQTLWETFPSYLVRTDVRGGRPVSTTTDPVVMDDFRPRPAVGLYADAISRVAAGTVPGRAQIGGPGATLDHGRKRPGRKETASLRTGEPRQLAPGWWADPDAGGDVRFGTDLLYGTGSFEGVSTSRSDPSRLWMLGKYAWLGSNGACDADWPTSGNGLEVARTPLSKKDVIAANAHRIPVGDQASLFADVRRAAPGSTLEVRWYGMAKGESMAVSTLELPEGSWGAGSCRDVRLDLDRPVGASYAQVYLRQQPPGGGQEVLRTAVDNVRFVEWSSQPLSGRAHDTVEATSDTSVTVRRDESSGSAEPFLER